MEAFDLDLNSVGLREENAFFPSKSEVSGKIMGGGGARQQSSIHRVELGGE